MHTNPRTTRKLPTHATMMMMNLVLEPLLSSLYDIDRVRNIAVMLVMERTGGSNSELMKESDKE